MTTVPRDWTALMGLVPEVLMARTEMLNSDASQQMRDEAVARYSRLADQMVSHLARLSETRDLGRITALLSKKERV